MKYHVAIADPAWRYNNSGVNGAAEDHYKASETTNRSTMATSEICALPVGEIMASDSVLYLWATWPLLKDALAVVDAWGFKYVTGFPWIKLTSDPERTLFGTYDIRPNFGTGWWVRACSEPLLIAKRGKEKPPEDVLLGLLCEAMQHSRKPENLYELAERHAGPYLELFARRRRAGWDAWGNEVEGSITL